MHEPQFVIFLLSLGILFGCARLIGGLMTRFGSPAVVGEILVGLLVGKTVLGRLWPDAFRWLFDGERAQVMLQGYRTIAVVLLLAVAGLEIEGSALRRRGGAFKAIAFTCLFSAAVPFALGYGTGLILPAHYLVDPSRRELHAVFFGIALAISALPVITRTLLDLGLLKTDIGTLVLSAAVVDDLVGWICFGALGREIRAGRGSGHGTILRSIAVTAGFMAAALIALRPLVDRWLRSIERSATTSATARSLSMIVILAMLGAAATEALGIHAVYGGFVIGLAIGSSPRLLQPTRQSLQDCVTSLFTPIFFATMALRYDFIAAFDPVLVAIVLAIAIIAKAAGSALGARLGGLTGREAWTIGFGLTSRGAMEILLASIALDARMINETMFVALVIMAIVTSLIAGPAMAWLVRLSPSPTQAQRANARAAETITAHGA
ncbi:MAG TPA: cation:proton antiporter [Kofleriaceae bacterium]|nr:cation:proton antiporter [Kofleriaceae bacterium]